MITLIVGFGCQVEKNYQKAFDVVYGMQIDEALALVWEAQNQKLKGLVSDLQLLQEENVRKVTSQALDDANPLHEAARHDRLDLAEALIRKGADVNAREKKADREFNSFETPLTIAAAEGRYKMVELLLGKGAYVNAKNSNNFNNWSPLHEAAYYGYDEVAELLLQKGAYIEAKDEKGNTPLVLAVQEGCKRWKKRDKVVKLLVRKGADVRGALNYAAKEKNAKYGNDIMWKLLKALTA